MVKESLFSHNDILMLEHLSRTGFEPCPFGSGVSNRQARSRLKRKIEKDSADFLAAHLEEWRAIKLSFDYGLLGEDVQNKLQRQIWDSRESIIRLLIDWIPNEVLGDFLNEFLVKRYFDEMLKDEGAADPFIPIRFWGHYLAQLNFEDPRIHCVCERLLKEIEKFELLTADKRAIVTFDTENDEEGLCKVWTMDKTMFNRFMAYEKSNREDTFVYVIPRSIFRSGGNEFIVVFYCQVVWYQWILSVAHQINFEGKKMVTYNQLMNRLSQLISFYLQTAIKENLRQFKELIENPFHPAEDIQGEVLQLLNNHFDHFRTNEPGRPSVARSKRRGLNRNGGPDDLYVKSLLEFLGEQGGIGRKVPLDEKGNPATGSGRGFKGFLRKRVNEMVSLGFLNSVGKGFSISKEGSEVWNHRPMLGVDSLIVPMALDKICERVDKYSLKFPNASKNNIVRAVFEIEMPGARILNNMDIFNIINDECTSGMNNKC